MSTTIEWTKRPGTKGETWNPTTGCNKLSAGCKNCYAEVMHGRQMFMNPRKYTQPFSAGVVSHADTLTIPLKWKKPRTVFVNSMSDLFHADVPFAYIDQVFAVMALTPQHTYQILTKRPERMAEYLNTPGRRELIEAAILDVMDANGLATNYVPWVAEQMDALPNVWLGTSVENQEAADKRIPYLLQCPAAVRFLSCEPLLGAVDLSPYLNMSPFGDALRGGYVLKGTGSAIDWVIAGGESGHNARPMLPDWPRLLRDQCKASGVSYFFKQWGAWHTAFKDMTTDAASFYQFRTFQQWVNKAGSWMQGGICLDKHGKQLKNGKDFMEARDNDAFPVTIMHKVGKHASGNVLDGVVHQEWPKVEVEQTTGTKQTQA